MHSFKLVVGLSALVLCAGCGDSVADDSGSQVSAGGTPADSAMGTGGTGFEMAPDASGGASAGNTGDTQPSGGAPSGGGSAVPAPGGAPNMEPSSNGGEGGAGGATEKEPDLKVEVAGALDGFRLEAPCIDDDHFGAEKIDNCDVTPEVDKQSHELQLGGDAAVTYDVKLRVRGLLEPNNYKNGRLVPPRFYIGGEAGHTGYTAYSLEVEQPQGVFFFNYNEVLGHLVFTVDYEVTIPMRGASKVAFKVNGQNSVPDGHGVSNRDEVVIPEVAPAPLPFNGQFLQVDVVAVEAQ